MSVRTLLGALALVFLVPPPGAYAQGLINPNISAIGDMRYVLRNNAAAALADQDNLSFEFEELEIDINNYLNPFVRADVFLSIGGLEGPIEIEEIYSTIVRGLPAQLRFGKYFLDIGKINSEHQHQWAWIQAPLMHRMFLGEEGAHVLGARASRLLGVGDTAVTVTLNAFRSDFFNTSIDQAASEVDSTDSEKAKIGYSGRVSAFHELNDTNFLEVGGSYLWSRPDFEKDLSAQVAVIDATYKWTPNQYKAMKIRAEGMLSDREIEDVATGAMHSVTALGAFSAAEIKFRRRFDTGGYFDWTQDIADNDLSMTAFGAFLGFMPAEDTARYSIVYRHEESDIYGGSSDSVSLQVLWALGPHKPHKF